eukprot:89644_1
MSIDLALVDINSDGLLRLQSSLKSLYPSLNIGTFTCDLSKYHNVQLLVDEIKDYFKTDSIQYLFNNVGIMDMEPIITANINNLEKYMDINFWSMVYCTQIFLPMIINCCQQKRQCTIVNTGSIASVMSASSFYMVTKHAVLSMTEAIKREFELYFPQTNDYLHICCLLPSYTATNLFSNTQKNVKSLNMSFKTNPMLQGIKQGFTLMERTVDDLVDKLFVGLKQKKFIIHGDKDASVASIEDRAEMIKSGDADQSLHFKQLLREIIKKKQSKSKL